MQCTSKELGERKFNVRFTKDIVHLPCGNSPCIFIFPILEKDCPTLLEKVGSEPGFLDNHIPDYQIELADFRIPKFKFSFEFEASGVLTEMVNSPTIGEKLYVLNILHKACIKVDEEGTEAAAVSIDVETLISRDANLRVLRFFRSVEGRSSFCNGDPQDLWQPPGDGVSLRFNPGRGGGGTGSDSKDNSWDLVNQGKILSVKKIINKATCEKLAVEATKKELRQSVHLAGSQTYKEECWTLYMLWFCLVHGKTRKSIVEHPFPPTSFGHSVG
ncbi:unnamed protein product [Brassica oleracea]